MDNLNVTQITYGTMDALQVENEQTVIVVMPKLGGKIASLFNKKKQFEAMYQSKQGYTLATYGAPFDAYDSSGYDDAFPNVTKEEVVIEDKTVAYLDHGDIWSAIFKWKKIQDGIRLTYKDEVRHYTYVKDIRLVGEGVKVTYNITNHAEEDLYYLWLLHMICKIEKGMYLELKEQGIQVIENASDGSCLGQEGNLTPYPKVLVEGEYRHFNTLFEAPLNGCEKYYFKHVFKEGYTRLVYPESDASIILKWDATQLPYVGVWITQGGYRGEYNCAIEPTTSYYDSVSKAIETKTHCVLKCNESVSFIMEISIE